MGKKWAKSVFAAYKLLCFHRRNLFVCVSRIARPSGRNWAGLYEGGVRYGGHCCFQCMYLTCNIFPQLTVANWLLRSPVSAIHECVQLHTGDVSFFHSCEHFLTFGATFFSLARLFFRWRDFFLWINFLVLETAARFIAGSSQKHE